METSSQYPLLKEKLPNEKLACWWSVPFITFIGILFGLSYVAFIRLPQDRPLTADPENFIGYKARYYLQELSSIGPRVSGTKANEITAVNFLLREIDVIALESNGLYTIETDVQVVSGKLWFYGMTHVYNSMQNVIVKITPKTSNHTNALLINSHFDSVATSPVAGDDGSMVAVMLAVLNSLTKSKQAVQHPIVFLLNGDEEKGLEAAHGFITQHKWAKDIKLVLNLDAGGIGGKEILLQTGPKNTRLIDYYNEAARYPHGQVLIEEIYESGFPGDTDYTVFRDYGNLTGLNLIFISNGFVYHTYLDKFSNLDDGSLQHAGENVLALARTLANSEDLDENFVPEKTDRGVYFDFLGLFFVNYSETLGIGINSTVAISSLLAIGVSIFIISRTTKTAFVRVFTQFFIIFVIQTTSVGLATASTFGIAYLLDYIGYTLSWYSQNWIMLGLYCCPYLFVSGIVPTLFLEIRFFKQLPIRFNIMLLQHSQCILFAASIGYFMYYQYRSTQLITYTVLFYTLSMLVNYLPAVQKRAHLWLVPYIIFQIIPLLFNSYVTYITITFILPLTGRSPGNPDLYLSEYILAATILLMGFNVPVFSIFRNTKSILSIFLVIFIVDFALVFTPVGFPYTDVTPQRQIIYHTTRTKYDINGEVTNWSPVFAGYFVDRHVEKTLKDVATENKLKYYTNDEDRKGLDFYNDSFAIIEGYELNIPNPSKVSLVSKEELSSEAGTYRYTFRIDGSAKTFRIFIQSLGKNTIVDWSFKLENETSERQRLITSVTFGKTSPSFTFWLVVKKRDTSPNTFSILVNFEYNDEDNQFSQPLNRFLKLFPNWTVQAPSITSCDTYEF